MNDERLKAIEQRLAIASSGPWTPVSGSNDGIVRRTEIGWDDEFIEIADCTGHEANAEFIAHAREDIPDLLALVHRQRKRIAALEDAVRGFLNTTRPIPRVFDGTSIFDGSHDGDLMAMAKALFANPVGAQASADGKPR